MLPRRSRVRTSLLAAALPVLTALLVPAAAGASGSAPTALVGWGEDFHGQIGAGYHSRWQTPETALLPAGVKEVALGMGGGLALMTDGSVYSWGGNIYGQLGLGYRNRYALRPVRIPSLSGVLQVAASGTHSMALLSNGTVEVWGSNLYGDLGNGTSTHGKEPAGDYVDVPQPVPGLHEVSYIAAGGPDDAAVLRNGTVYAWGQNASGQLGDGTRVEKEVPVQVQHLSGVRSVAIGAFPSSGGHMLALLDNGTVMALGRNDQGQLGDGTTVDSPTPVSVSRLSHVVAISADISHSLALTSNGVLYAFGGNEYGQLGVGSGPESCEGRPCSRVPVALAPRPVTSMSAGFRYSTAVVRGTPYAWGWNTQGQLGDGTTVQKDTPTPVAGVHGASMVAASWYYTFAGLDGPGPPRPVALFRAGSALNLSWLPGGTTSRWHVSWRVAPRGTWGPEAVLPPTARSHSIAGMSFTVPYEVRLSPGGGNGRVLQWGEADPWLWNSGMPPGETTEGEEEETEEQEPPTAPALAPVTPVPPAPAPHAAETAAPTSAAPSPTRMLGG